MEISSYGADSAGPADRTGAKSIPRPTSPAERLVFPSSAASETCIPHEETDFLQDEQMSGQENGYNSSASSAQQSSSESLRKELDDEELAHLNSRASSRSSVSSVPGSVLIHPPDGIKSSFATGTHDPFAYSWGGNGNTTYGKVDALGKSVHTLRQRETAFRKPSSVRAMQMHTEDEDDEYLTPPRRRGQRNSDISMRSTGSPLRKSPYYSPSGSGSKQKLKKEYPLVLLHCSLLPPSLPLPNGVGLPSQKILKEVLPPQYWRRWRLLQEKVGSGVLRDRGVLISHPQDMYDVLEERLLESLELQRPRLDKGHFLGQETDSEREDYPGKEESATDDEQGEQCPDCGGRVIRGSHSDRKWELKVFAANGLMRAGAWAAAWKEMEKVDVEVGLWLPTDVRRELERTLLEDEKFGYAEGSQGYLERESESGRRDSRLNDFDDSDRLDDFQRESFSAEQEMKPQERQGSATATSTEHPVEVDLQTLLINYVRLLASDRRNIAISILSIVVVLFAIGGTDRVPGTDLRPFPQGMFDSGPVLSAAVSSDSTLASESLGSFTILNAGPSADPIPHSAEATESVVSSISEASREANSTAISENSELSMEPTELRASSTAEMDPDATTPTTKEPGLSIEPPKSTSEPTESIENVSTPEPTALEEDSVDPSNGED